jgi:hypothetical protein
MKLKKFSDIKKINERGDEFDQYERDSLNPAWQLDGDDDDLDIDLPELPEEEVEVEINHDDEIESLLSTLRKIVKAAFDRSYVTMDEEGCINIQFILNRTEKMSGVMKAMSILKKLETDILIQYESEFDLWETKDGFPLLTGKFFYDEDVSATTSLDEIDDEVPF